MKYSAYFLFFLASVLLHFPSYSLAETEQQDMYEEEVDSLFQLDDIHTQSEKQEPYDPFEKMNRTMFEINRGIISFFYRHAKKNLFNLQPAENKPTEKHSGKVLVSCIDNVLNNLNTPARVINHLLQGNPGAAVQTIWRFAINSTLGVGGLVDIAEHSFNMPIKRASYKKTLAMYGAKNGAYFFFPVIGATSVRNSIAAILEMLSSPITIFAPEEYKLLSTVVYRYQKISEEIRFYPIVFENNIDPYAKLRAMSTSYIGH